MHERQLQPQCSGTQLENSYRDRHGGGSASDSRAVQCDLRQIQSLHQETAEEHKPASQKTQKG